MSFEAHLQVRRQQLDDGGNIADVLLPFLDDRTVPFQRHDCAEIGDVRLYCVEERLHIHSLFRGDGTLVSISDSSSQQYRGGWCVRPRDMFCLMCSGFSGVHRSHCLQFYTLIVTLTAVYGP